ncbi:hypothetical protein Ate01nite_25440 [Actinoplanes teichomyceticus]|nr:hypothetical protein Ate01nite_25440 [Actinoplanes teichomyceticus]
MAGVGQPADRRIAAGIGHPDGVAQALDPVGRDPWSGRPEASLWPVSGRPAADRPYSVSRR